MNVLVTGASGFVGHYLVADLARAGHQVTGVVRPNSSEPIPEVPDTIVADVTDGERMRAVVEAVGPDAIVHLAGASSVARSFTEPLQTWNVNLVGTLAVLEAARMQLPALPRVMVVTSSEMFGRVSIDSLPVDEGTPVRPVSPYGASKAAADAVATQYHQWYGIDVIRVCPFNHIGPGQDGRFVVPSIARQIAAAEYRAEREVVLRVGNISTRRDFTDVRDVAGAYVALLEAGSSEYPYFVCSGQSRSIEELIDRLSSMTDIHVRLERDATLARSGEQADLYGTSARITDQTGWRPRISIDQTLSDTLDWWRARAAD